MERIDLALSSQ
jgi:hypothetical protein